MMIKLFKAMCFIIFVAAALPISAENSYQIERGGDLIELADYQYLTQSEIVTNNIDEIAALQNHQWQQSIGRPVIYQGNNWIKLTLENTRSWQKAATMLIKITPYMSSVSVFSSVNKRAAIKHILQKNRNNFVEKKFFLPLNSKTEVYINIKTDIDTPLLVSIIGSQRYIDNIRNVEFYKGLALGGYIFLCLALLILCIAMKSSSLSLLFAYFISQTCILFSLFGNNFSYYFPQYPELRAVEIPLLISLSAVLLIAFISQVFMLKSHYLNLYKQLRYTCKALAIFAICSVFLPISTKLSLTMLVDSLVAGQLIYVGILLMRAKVPLASLFTFCVSIQLLLGAIFSSGIFWHNNEIFSYSDPFLSFSFWVNAFLIIFLVSRFFHLQIKGKQKAQKLALKSAMENKKAQKKLITLKEENEKELENRVQERTLELNIAFQELEELNKELAAKSTHDDLTSLYNRRYYDQKIQAEFRRSRRNLTALSLIVVDIDHFKKVNDTMGHLAGDECLKVLAKRIQQSLRRSSDVSCRYGGEEFCLILPETNQQGAKALAEELRQTVENNPVHYEGKVINLTISCGYSTYFQQKNINTEDLFLAADKALYLAKDNGRNQIQAYNLDTINS